MPVIYAVKINIQPGKTISIYVQEVKGINKKDVYNIISLLYNRQIFPVQD